MKQAVRFFNEAMGSGATPAQIHTNISKALKSAGFKVKKFQKMTHGYGGIWGGFYTVGDGMVLPFHVKKDGKVSYDAGPKDWIIGNIDYVDVMTRILKQVKKMPGYGQDIISKVRRTKKIASEGTRFRVRKSDARAVTKLILRNRWSAEKANMGRDVRFDIEGDDKKIMNTLADHGIIISHLDEAKAEDFVVTALKGGHSSGSNRYDWIVTAKSAKEAEAKVIKRKGRMRSIAARPTSDFKGLDPYKVYKRLKESVDEGNLPSNIQKWIKARGPKPSKDVKMIGKWVKKLTGREISGGVAIGKNYNTLVLDIEYQDAAIYYDTTSGDIKLYNKKIRSSNDFKKVFQANESVNEVGKPLVNTLNHAIDDVDRLMDVVTGDQAKDAFSYPIRSTKFLKIAQKALEKVK